MRPTRVWGVSFASFLAYAAIDVILRPAAGASIGAVGLIPVILTGYVGGLRPGAWAGLAYAPLLLVLALIEGSAPGPFLAQNVHGILIAAGAGPVTGWMGDMQRRLRARAHALEEERAYAQHLIEDANAMIVGVDADGRVRTFNRRAETAFGRSKEDVIGTPWWATILPVEEYPHLAPHATGARLEASEIPRVFEMPLRNADGTQRLTTWRISPVEKDGHFDGIIAYGTEATTGRSTDLAAVSPVARAVVQELVAALSREGSVGNTAARGVGRSIAAALPPGTLDAHVAAYHAMGLGRLRVRASSKDRLEVSGDDLLEQRLSSHQPTCYIALGFLEGVAAAAFGVECLGSEVRCTSQGGPHCEFVVCSRNAAPRIREAPVPR